MTVQDINLMLQESFKDNFNETALIDFINGQKLSYSDIAQKVAKIHILFQRIGISKGDKIALTGIYSPSWVISYISTITYGAVVVPILSDLLVPDMTNIINHSDSRLLFIDNLTVINLKNVSLPRIEGIINMQNLEFIDGDANTLLAIDSLNKSFQSKFSNTFQPTDISYDKTDPDDVISISYISGASGISKGAMLTSGNLSSNVKFTIEHKFHFKGSSVLAIFPFAHAYGCTFDVISPLVAGSAITLLGKLPSSSLLLKALKVSRPHLLCCVPLIIEEIVTGQIFPRLNKPVYKFIAGIPFCKKAFYGIIRKKMIDTLGGRIMEVNIGGDSLSEDVAAFLTKIKFPYTIGYGMTESAPLIGYERWNPTKYDSCGKLLSSNEQNVSSAKMLKQNGI